MQIAIVGSFPDEPDPRWPQRGSFEEFREACFSLGQMIAEEGYDLLVQHDRPDTADCYAVDGFLTRLGARSSQRIQVWRPQRSSRYPFEDLTKKHSSVIVQKDAGIGKWDSARFRMCTHAHATILIGGQSRTETTGLVVMAAQRLLLPLAGFGGAAAALVPILEHPFTRIKPLPPELSIDILQSFWSKDLVDKVRLGLKHKQPNLVLIHGRDQNAVNSVIAILAKNNLPMPKLMVWDYKPGETLIQKWQRVASDPATIAIAIASADDLGKFKDDADLALRARQNVWLEVGWFWGISRDPSRILILAQKGIREGAPSDLSGLELFEWKSDPAEQETAIEKFIRSFD